MTKRSAPAYRQVPKDRHAAKRTDLRFVNSENPTSDNLTPQATTKPEAPDMGIDGAELAYPGSSVVADDGQTKDRDTM